MPKGKPTPIARPKPPTWINKLSPHDFPWCYRNFYSYLCRFPSRECCLYNYRLADRFGVSDRQIQRWLTWLIRHALVARSLRFVKPPHRHPSSLYTKRRIIVEHYPTVEAWLISLTKYHLASTARKHRLVSSQKTDFSNLTPAQETARKDELKRQLFALKQGVKHVTL